MAKSSKGSPSTASSIALRALHAPAFLIALALGWTAALPSATAGGDDCTAASEALARAQAALSKAMRDADTRADAYAQCMAGGGSCATKKAAFDAAITAKGKALAALKAASEHRKTVCH